ncbi:hypothetical protein A2975_02365 [Candidatus Woesebacteria bacterium RIFCSPLOWO2_01_FULL_44_14]|uniref:DUF5672 domain-containing protein n=1 Tax=Candidatus Woesebacteria bacterium RIFCSPLOWO2_01_FULL_44_14 TaxID=1802525 RepID=A0A1F8BZ41_9BACT|nr:MAG: hypothetical protein A2975_02365 [Candidatus Woesebacteria bacterium RIFCSPLOWO2_01_FULL_44_14]
MNKGCIYYTDNRPKQFILEACRDQIKKAWPGKLVSVSLGQPLNFGQNLVLTGYERSYTTMVKQIVMALEALDTEIVFFLEHDVLYHPSHFDFTPPRKEIYYYNTNNWRWGIKEDFAITYDRLVSLSQLCCFRAIALSHYQARLKYILDRGLDKIMGRDPKWARIMGFEPGTKPRQKGGFSDEKFDVWRSPLPNIDIRHRHTYSPPKYRLSDFKHSPENWRQERLENLPYWNLKTLHDKWLDQYVIN